MKRKFKNGKRLIRRICACRNCNRRTNYGKKYISGHNITFLNKKHTRKSKEKMSSSQMSNTNAKGLKGHKQTEEHKRNNSIAKMGNTNALGFKHTKEARKNISIGLIKPHPNDKYCEIWRDKEYKDDMRKDYCENKDCKKTYKQLGLHHIYLDKKRCAPGDIMTLCNPCHVALHQMLAHQSTVNPKNFIITNRPDHISYIHKKSRKIIRINKVIL